MCGTGNVVPHSVCGTGAPCLGDSATRRELSVAGEKPAKVVAHTLTRLQLKKCESRRKIIYKKIQFSKVRLWKLRIDAKLSQTDSDLVSLSDLRW